MAIYKWVAGNHILLWPSLYRSKEQKSKVMEVRHRFVTLTLNLHCKDDIQLKSDYEPLLIEFRMATKFHCIADYGVPCMVLVWSALSFSVPTRIPSGIPRRLFSPLPWVSASLHHWTVIKVRICSYFFFLCLFLQGCWVLYHATFFVTPSCGERTYHLLVKEYYVLKWRRIKISYQYVVSDCMEMEMFRKHKRND